MPATFPWTLEDREADRGAEPDECYVFGQVADPKRPHLTIEVVWGSVEAEREPERLVDLA